MRLFWNRSSKNLAELFGDLSSKAPSALLDPVERFFADQIFDAIDDLHLRSPHQDHILAREVVNELASLLSSRREQWKTFLKKDVDRLIPDLTKACEWKLQIADYPYSLENTADLVKKGRAVMPALDEILYSLEKETSRSVFKRQAAKYLVNPDDYAEVTTRALRCVLTSLRRDGRTKQSIFEWNTRYQLLIKRAFIDKYLFEQLAVHAFINKQDRNALPTDRVRIGVMRYVHKRLHTLQVSPDIAGDIVQDTFKSFTDKIPTYTPAQFYIDKRLTSYFIRLVRNGYKIKQYIAEDLKLRRFMSLEDLDRDEKENELRALEKENDYLAAAKEFLHECVKSLDEVCRDIIYARYYNDYSQPLSYSAVGESLGINGKTADSRGRSCLIKLRSCVISKLIRWEQQH